MSSCHLKWLWLVLALMVLPGVCVWGKEKKVRQVVIKEVTRVEGKVQKPEVWYLLPRSNLNFEGLKLDQDLIPKIEESTKKPPF